MFFIKCKLNLYLFYSSISLILSYRFFRKLSRLCWVLAQHIPFSLSAALPSMCVLGNFPPFLKITFTLSSTTQITRIMTVINNVVSIFSIFVDANIRV